MNYHASARSAPSVGTWIAARLTSFVWPPGEPMLKARSIGAISLIIAGKLVGVSVPLFYKSIVDALSVSTIVIVPATIILAYGLAHVGVQVVNRLRQLVFIHVVQHATRQIALEMFRHLHALSLRFHLDRQTGGVMRIFSRGLAGMEFLLELVAFNLAPTLFELALVTAILWSFYSAAFSFVVAATILLYICFTVIATRWQVLRRREMNAADVAANIRAMDSLLNFETVKYFGAEVHEATRYEGDRRAYEKAAIRNETTEALVAMGQGTIIAAGLVLIMLMAAGGVASGTMTVGDFVLMIAYLLQLHAPLGALGTVYGHTKQSLADVEALWQLLSERPDIEDRPGAAPLTVQHGHLQFDRVSFAYDSRRPILRSVSFEIPPGKTVALVGASGSGKSTVARLLLRLYDVDSGTITIDGQDVRDVTQLSLRQAIGVVPQDTVLFNDTIGYNIAFGRADANCEDVKQAGRLAQIHNFILLMPGGYDTIVGERGLKLSGGEKQRVAIARVIVKRPRLLIFDEATSALDSHTEGEIQACLQQVSARRSTLVIAHRLSTIINADEILVLDKGRIVERGRHEDLIAAGGAYASMWVRQHRRAPQTATIAG